MRAGLRRPLARCLRRRRESSLSQRSIRTEAHGVTMKAISNDQNIAALAPIGIGRMYGPINPPTNAIGKTAAITAKRRQDRRIAHLAHRLDRDLRPVAAPVLRQVKVPDDVLHHHDRVIHQDADAEDQREQRDAVQRESVQVETPAASARASPGIATATIPDSRQPSVSQINIDTLNTAMPMCSSSSFDFSAAVSP
jgi:hypothetical protein